MLSFAGEILKDVFLCGVGGIYTIGFNDVTCQSWRC